MTENILSAIQKMITKMSGSMPRRIDSMIKLLFCILILSVPCVGIATETSLPLTEYGHPDLSGVWNFSTSTPLEREALYEGRELLTQAEIVKIKTDRETTWDTFGETEENISSRLVASNNASSVGTVNLFWAELFPLRENTRTSLITHPKNGRIPPVKKNVVIQRGDRTGVSELPGNRPVRYTHGGIASDGPEDRGLSERCLVFNSGPPLRSGAYNNNIQIIQNSDHVVILMEMGFDARIVPLNKKSHIHEDITLWSGDSLGHFEEETLVVNTRNFTNKIASLGLQGIAYGSAEDRVLVERFTPTSATTLDYEYTIEDATTFTDSIVAVIPMTKVDTQIFEYACHEGNYALANILKGARSKERLTN